MQRETNNNITEDKDIWIKIENNQIKESHVKEDMANKLASLEAGAYCNSARCRFIHSNNCVCCCFQHSLPITVFAVFATQFSEITTILAYQNIFNSLCLLNVTRLCNS